PLTPHGRSTSARTRRRRSPHWRRTLEHGRCGYTLRDRRPTRCGSRRRSASTRGASVSDMIAVRGLSVNGRHGVYPDERRDGQTFVVDALLWLDTREAAASDALGDT